MHLPATPSLGQLALPVNPRPDLGTLATAGAATHGATALAWLTDQIGRRQHRAVAVLPARLGVAATALLTQLGGAGLLDEITVVLVDTDCTAPAPSSEHAALLRRLGVTPLVLKPRGCSTTADFDEIYGRSLRDEDPETYAEVTWTEPVARAMALRAGTLRITARYKTGPGKTKIDDLVYADSKWLRCDPLAAASLAELKCLVRTGSPPGLTATLAAETMPRAVSAVPSSMTLVGAGPGDPGLLTVAALEALRKADVVLADRLCPEAIVRLATGTVMVARKTPGNAAVAQEELNQAGLAALRQGKAVVRLKGGDPFVFGRGGEEAVFYKKHGYRVRVIPGISSSVAAASCAGIPVTSRGFADQLLVTSAHGSDHRLPELPPFSDRCTYVFLMGVSRLRQLMDGLIKHGFPPAYPVAIVQDGSLPTQRVLRSTVERVAETAAAMQISSPSVIVIGKVVDAIGTDSVVPFPEWAHITA